jgi:hypothetical protein
MGHEHQSPALIEGAGFALVMVCPFFCWALMFPMAVWAEQVKQQSFDNRAATSQAVFRLETIELRNQVLRKLQLDRPTLQRLVMRHG